MDKLGDNCGLLKRKMGIITRTFTKSLNGLWITVDDVWMNFYAFIRGNFTYTQFHKPITVMNSFNTYKYIGGQK